MEDCKAMLSRNKELYIKQEHQPHHYFIIVTYPPGRSIWWPRAVLHQVSLRFGQLLGEADLGQMYPWVEASGGQEWY